GISRPVACARDGAPFAALGRARPARHRIALRRMGEPSPHRCMRIVITADPYLPVPPIYYGGIERVIDLLVRGLVERGHEVTLLGHPGSRTPARLIAYGRPPHVGRSRRLVELAQVGGWLWRHRSKIDVIHSFGRLAALLPVLPDRRLPKIQSYQRDGVPWASVARASRLAGSSLIFTGCSTSVYREAAGDESAAGRWRTIFNGVDIARYACRSAVRRDAPLIFLGRLDPIKGAHHAIAIARASGRRLTIAGNRLTAGPDAGDFAARIAPHLDGDRVMYVGPA